MEEFEPFSRNYRPTYPAAENLSLEQVSLMKDMKRVVFGDMPIEAGYCNGRGFQLNAMEYHKCSEVNFTTTGLVLLLGLPEQLDDGKFDSADVVGFYLPAGVLVEVFPSWIRLTPRPRARRRCSGCETSG